MRVLAIDTSSPVLGVAVLDENGQGAEFNCDLGLRHASHLVPTIKKALSFSGLTLKDIGAYCVSIGPGSFTGLRIGVSTIKALWLADKKKVAAVPTLDVLARNIPDTDDTICVVIDAKKEKLYARFYRCRSSARSGTAPYTISDRRGFLTPPRRGGTGMARLSINVGAVPRTARLFAITPALLVGYQDLIDRFSKIKNDILLVGDGAEALSRHCERGNDIKFASREFWYPRAINVARIGVEMLRQGKVVKAVDALVPLYLHPKDVQCKR